MDQLHTHLDVLEQQRLTVSHRHTRQGAPGYGPSGWCSGG
jgi:hypothetical protein